MMRTRVAARTRLWSSKRDLDLGVLTKVDIGLDELLSAEFYARLT